jgi:hypothetical protein
MAKKRTPTHLAPAGIDDAAYDAVLTDVARLIEWARHAAAGSVNAVMTATYWEVGRRIVEQEQRGKDRAGYGEQLITRMAGDLTQRYGRGFGYRNLYQMRQFYTTYPPILQTASAKFRQRALSGEPPITETTVAELGKRFPLSWSHYVRLMSVEKPEARAFYEAEALRGGWTVRQLDRQIATYLAECQFQRKKYVAAHDSYEQLVLNYPQTDHRDTLVSREFAIAQIWLSQDDPAARSDQALPWYSRFNGGQPLIDTAGAARDV